MNRVARLLDALLPALIHLNPMVAAAYYQAVALDADSPTGAETAARSSLVFHAPRVVTVIDLAQAPKPASVRS